MIIVENYTLQKGLNVTVILAFCSMGQSITRRNSSYHTWCITSSYSFDIAHYCYHILCSQKK